MVWKYYINDLDDKMEYFGTPYCKTKQKTNKQKTNKTKQTPTTKKKKKKKKPSLGHRECVCTSPSAARGLV